MVIMHWSSVIPISFVLIRLVAAQGLQNDGRSPPHYPSPWMRGGAGWEAAYQKAIAFVSDLTLLEKVNLTTGTGWTQDLCVGNTGSIPRKNFHGFCLQDSPLGIRFTDGNSAFPSGMNVAATWSTRLFKSRGRAMGAEFAGKGIDVLLGPVAGPLGRIPQGGRNWEGFSPDPYLTGKAIAETIKGVQDAGVIACAKHLVGNEQERYREVMSSNIDDQTMHEVYLWPFADAVRAGVGSVMCSYNRLDDSYACENSHLINLLLKNELDFQGFVMSDWGAQHSGVASALAGLDMSMPGEQRFGVGTYSYWGGNLTAAVLNGTVPQWRIDDMAVRIMSAYFKVGRDRVRIPPNFSSWTLNDTGFVHQLGESDFRVINQHIDVQADHKRVIREIAVRSTVLLKNERNALPLNKPSTVAVIGEDAHSNPDGTNSCPDRDCNKGTLAMGWGSGTANFPYLVAPVDALREQARRDNTVFLNSSDNYDLPTARAYASNASTALVFGNANSGEAFITVDNNAGDRRNLTLWNGADDLIRAVAAVNPNTILILHTVGAVLIEEYKNHPNITAIIWAGIPGQESGNALTDILYGKQNPSGKTVFTWPKSVDQVPGIYVDDLSPIPQDEFTEGQLIDYRFFDRYAGLPTLNGGPSYPFGFGISYTTFNYSDVKVNKLFHGDYRPNTGRTKAAPIFGTIDNSTEANSMPADFIPVKAYVYPFIDETTGKPEGGDWNGDAPPGSQDGSPQPKLAAGGSAGGNSGLWEDLFEVVAVITNTGSRAGVEVAQLYLGEGYSCNPCRTLRGFDDVSLQPGESKTVKFRLTRRDVSRWNTANQNWEITTYSKWVNVGGSSRFEDLGEKVYLEF